MSALSNFLFGKKGRFEEIERFTPEQKSIFSQILENIKTPLGMGFQNLMQLLSGSQEGLETYQRPAMRQFEQEIMPSIAERFSGLGAQRSSAFGQQLGQAGASLAENLASQRANLQSQALGQLQQLLGLGMTPQFETLYRPATSGFLGSLAPALGQGMGLGSSLGLLSLMGLR